MAAPLGEASRMDLRHHEPPRRGAAERFPTCSVELPDHSRLDAIEYPVVHEPIGFN